ncbi:MAG: hypothetical protein HQK98_09220 [Nitrospirae bacterium]|nr:hypothetical protein [Nitrospirota bacterium]
MKYQRGAELSDRAAKEIAEVFREIVEDRLTTKTDLEMAKFELKTEIAKSKSDIELGIAKAKVKTLKMWLIIVWVAQLFAMFAMFKAFIK